MTIANSTGITSSLNGLILTRPAKNVTGFAPSGKVATHMWGSNQSLYHGRGMEYAESRLYQHGDDVKNIDWRVTARTGKTYTKLFQEERERPVFILADLRAHMLFGTRVRFKSHLATELAAKLAWVGHDGGDRVGGQILTQSGIQDIKPVRTRRGMLHFLDSLVDANTALISASINSSGNKRIVQSIAQSNDTLATSIQRLTKVCRAGSLVFIISDFHDDADTQGSAQSQLHQSLRRLSKHAHVTLIQVTDPLDQHLPANGGRLSDGQAVLAMQQLSKNQLNQYAQQFTLRQQALQKLCSQHQMVFHHLQTDEPASQIFQPYANVSLKSKTNKAKQLRGQA